MKWTIEEVQLSAFRFMLRMGSIVAHVWIALFNALFILLDVGVVVVYAAFPAFLLYWFGVPRWWAIGISATAIGTLKIKYDCD
jgi:hypothetical protein